MRLLGKLKLERIYYRFIRHLAEILIIFIGITISFLFDQWRDENRQKQELIELAESLLRDAIIGKNHLTSDLEGTESWISVLDSLRIQRDSKKIEESKLIWLYDFLAGKTFGLFDSNSPAYLSAISSRMLTKLPDSIQLKIYDVYEAKLPDFQFLYDQQLESVKHFRNEVMTQDNMYLYHTRSSTVQIDLMKFALEVERPVYGNFINQIIIAEMEIRGRNIGLTEDFDSIIKSLQEYIKALKTQ